MENKAKRFLIIDSNSVIHRAYHALPPLTTKKGALVNAVYGFLLVFLKALKDFQPNYIAAAFDLSGPTFRHIKYKEYKAKRPKTPEELYLQIPKIKEVLAAFNVSIFEKQGFEADDIIGTLAFLSPAETIILSGDSDTLQLVDFKTKVCALRKGVKDIVLYDENLVKEKFQGLFPEQVLDFKALRGDPSDNIPGVSGVGEKTAIQLLLKFGNLENIYKEIEENSQASQSIRLKLRKIILKYKEQAFLSKDLAKIEKTVPLDFLLQECCWQKINKEKISQVFEKFGFYSLIKRINNNEFLSCPFQLDLHKEDKKLKVENKNNNVNLKN